MRGDGAARHCDSCDELVHDLSAMSEDEAQALLREHGDEKPCVRYRFDAAGRLLFAAALSVVMGGSITSCMGKPGGECDPIEPVVATPYDPPTNTESIEGQPVDGEQSGEPAGEAPSEPASEAPGEPSNSQGPSQGPTQGHT